MGTGQNALQSHPDIIIIAVGSKVSRYRILQPLMSWLMSRVIVAWMVSSFK